ncbi:hypothetical protein UlMin_033717 [Ulmus minor]
MRNLVSRLSSTSVSKITSASRVLNEKIKHVFGNSPVIPSKNGIQAYQFVNSQVFSSTSRGDGENDSNDDWGKPVGGTFGCSSSDDLGWDSMSSWSTGLTKDHFDGEVAGHRSSGRDIFFNSHDREVHVASLPYKPDFKVMPEGWDGTTRDLDEVHYKISKKEDEMLYQEFVQRMNFNKKKMAGEVFHHKFSRRCPLDGWNFTVEKLGSRGKREGSGGGWKFVSMADGSSRPLNDMEKMYVKRETPRHRRKILP